MKAPAEQTSGNCHNGVQPDVSSDPIGLISMKEGENDKFDLPEQRMEDSPAPAAQVTGKYPVKLRPEAFKRGIDSFEKKLTTAFFTHRRIVTLHTAMPLSFSPNSPEFGRSAGPCGVRLFC